MEEQKTNPNLLRPCLADGKPAAFHRWVDDDRALLRVNAFMQFDDQKRRVQRFREEGVLDNACTVEILRCCAALVEYPDGAVDIVDPKRIKFLDRKED